MKPKLLLLALVCSATVLCAGDFMPSFEAPRVIEPKIPDITLRVTDFGAVADGKTLNTEAIGKAIAALSQKGGGRLIFSPGIWLTGPIGLKSNVELYLEEGAFVQFDPDPKLYPSRLVDFKGRKVSLTTSPIYGENLENIAITGRGVMDGAGDAWRPVKRAKVSESEWKKLLAGTNGVLQGENLWWPSREAMSDNRPVLLKLVHCRKILLEGVTFQNSPMWNLNPTFCEDVTIRNVIVRNPWHSENGDGLDIENCRNVIIRDSRLDVGDDAICLKSGMNEEGRRRATPTENVLIENCVVYHGHGGVTIGSEMSSGVRNVRVNNCTFIGTDMGLRFKSTRGRGGVVEKIYISNIRMTDIPTDAISFNLYYANRAPEDEVMGGFTESRPAPVSEATPQFRDIYLENVVCRGARRAIALQGLPEMPLRGVHLRNISITAVYGVMCNDVADISFERSEILNSRGPVLTFAGSHDVRLDRLSYRAGAEIMASAQGTNNANIVIANTDFKAAKKDFDLSYGASRAVFEVRSQ